MPVAVGYGSCLASNRITADDQLVGYCYREPADSDVDSGWRFFAGDESQPYADAPENFRLLDVNTIANYDAAILSVLGAAAGSAFERLSSGSFLPLLKSFHSTHRLLSSG